MHWEFKAKATKGDPAEREQKGEKEQRVKGGMIRDGERGERKAQNFVLLTS